jgi:hypothetical protein
MIDPELTDKILLVTGAKARRARPRVTGWTAWVLLAASGLGLTACDERSQRVGDQAVEIPLTALGPLRPGEVPFGRIADLEVGDDGSVFVLDGLSRTVRVFDRAGEELRSFGQRGRGPGELEEPARLLWGPDGNLWVHDLGNSRLTEFSPRGELVGTYRSSDLPIFFPLAVGFVGTDTLAWVGISSPDLANLAAARVETHVVQGVVTPSLTKELRFVEWPVLFEYYGSGMSLVLPVPFSGEPQFGFDATGGLWYAHTGVPRLHRVSRAAHLQLTVSVDARPTPVSAMDREEALASHDLEEVHAIGQAAVAEMTGMIPDTKPYLAGFFFDDEQRVWVIHAEGDAAGSHERQVDIYNLDGTPVGRARAVLSAEPRPRIRDGLLAAVVRDELDIESVVLYRVGP